MTDPIKAVDKEPHKLISGEYCKWRGEWYAMPPGTTLLAGLERHAVTEHEDGTITISPSILVSNGRDSWHGHLEHGVWRKV